MRATSWTVRRWPRTDCSCSSPVASHRLVGGRQPPPRGRLVQLGGGGVGRVGRRAGRLGWPREAGSGPARSGDRLGTAPPLAVVVQRRGRRRPDHQPGCTRDAAWRPATMSPMEGPGTTSAGALPVGLRDRCGPGRAGRRRAGPVAPGDGRAVGAAGTSVRLPDCHQLDGGAVALAGPDVDAHGRETRDRGLASQLLGGDVEHVSVHGDDELAAGAKNAGHLREPRRPVPQHHVVDRQGGVDGAVPGSRCSPRCRHGSLRRPRRSERRSE